MSTATDLLLARLERYAATFRPAMAGRILRAYEIMRTSMTDAEITKLLASGASAERVASALTREPWFKQALTGVGTGAQDITLRSAKQYAAELPRDARDAVKLGIDLSNPRIADAMVTMNSRATAQLTKDAAETMRQVVKTGMEAGKGSKAIAKTLRESIGLAPNQEQAVRHFEEMLGAGDRTALSRALRDKRYDATLNRALGPGGKGLTEQQITTMADAYRRKMVAFNANTQARTLANDAQRAGQRLAWEDAIGKGVVDRANLWKQRVSMRDGKVRDEHVEWDGEVRRFDEPYSSGELVVGELSWGCRCAEILWEDETGERFGAGRGPRSLEGQAPVHPVAAPDPPVAPPAIPIEFGQGTSRAFQEEVTKAVDAMPPAVREALAAADIRVKTAQRMTQLRPDLRGKTPAGWPSGTTWDAVNGCFTVEERAVMVTEQYVGHAGNVVRHELGHAFDASLGRGAGRAATWRSASTEFMEAYRADVAALPAIRRGRVTYYLQRGDAGPREAFAEVAATIMGGGVDISPKVMLNLFPRVHQYLLKLIGGG